MPRWRGKQSCLDRAYGLLARRAHSVRELREKLLAREYESGEVETVLGRLIELGHLNDDLYCRQYARARVSRMRLGPKRLRGDLARKGFDGELVETVLGEVYNAEDDEMAVALRAAAKKAGSFKKGADKNEIRRKMFDHLARKGFSLEVARRISLDMMDSIIEKGGAK